MCVCIGVHRAATLVGCDDDKCHNYHLWACNRCRCHFHIPSASASGYSVANATAPATARDTSHGKHAAGAISEISASAAGNFAEFPIALLIDWLGVARRGITLLWSRVPACEVGRETIPFEDRWRCTASKAGWSSLHDFATDSRRQRSYNVERGADINFKCVINATRRAAGCRKGARIYVCACVSTFHLSQVSSHFFRFSILI